MAKFDAIRTGLLKALWGNPQAAVRMRVSTLLMLLALLGWPAVMGWLGWPFGAVAHEGWGNALRWVWFDLPALLLVCAWGAALVEVLILMCLRRWGGVCQCASEMVVCLLCAIMLPAY